jgi:titin
VEILEHRAVPSVFLVTNTSNGGAGSLRQAILDANVNPGSDIIEFDIEPGGAQTIPLTSPLPTLADTVFIDATTQPGWVASPLITVTNEGGFGSNGLTLTADGCKVKGLELTKFTLAGVGVYSNNNVIADDWVESNGIGVEIANAVSGNVLGGTTVRSRNVISGNSAEGVYIHEGSTGNLVEGNYIGTQANGSGAFANGYDGVDLLDGASNNTVGGTATGAGNLISGNSMDGIFIDKDATADVVQGNKIGTDVNGTAAVANGADGIDLSGSSGDTVGGTAARAGNLISGNSSDGLLITDGGTGNLVQGNKIGTDTTGNVAVANGRDGVYIFDGASNNTVGGTAAGAGNLISGNSLSGILISDAGPGNLVQGNKVGTDAAGIAALGNALEGVDIVGASADTIGGTAAGAGNLISGNSFDGLLITDGATGNLVQGNQIGTKASGTASLANGHSGVDIDGASGNTVGGTAVGAGNLISGNGIDGILLDDAATGNLVQGNKVGTDAAGTAALANGGDGVHLLFTAKNTVGGTAAGAGNLISGNFVDGIFLGSVATGNLVQGNRIGTNAAGTAAVANGFDGVGILAGSTNTVGGTAASAGNLISGNSRNGILIDEAATGNQVQGNQIGTKAAGTDALANGANGVLLLASNNTIGGTTAGAANTIAFNNGDGVFVESGSGNAIRRNSIFANSGLGIRLNPGANNNQPAPTLTSAMYNHFSHFLTVRGTMTGAAGSQVTVEFFANPAGDPEGKTFLGSLVVTIVAGGKVNFTLMLKTKTLNPGTVITATATDAGNDTSEFSAGQKVM